MTVGEYTRRVSHREHQAWLRYLDDEFNQPDRTDYYLMQIAAVIQGLFARGVKMDSFRLKFGKKKSAGEYLADIKANFGAILGMDLRQHKNGRN